MAKDKEARVTLSLFNADFNKAIKETKQETAQLNKEYELQKQQMKLTASETEQLAAKVEYLKSKQELAARTTAETVQQYERVKQQFGENSEAAKKMANAVTEAKIAEQKLANEVTLTDRALEKAKQTEIDLALKVEQTTDSLEKQKKTAAETAEQLKAMGDSAKGAGEGLTAGLTVPLAAIGTSALLAATQFDTAQAQLQGQLGITAEEAAKLGDVAQAVWEKGFGEDVVQVTTDLSLLKQQFSNLNDADLSQLLESGYMLQQNFGFELNETTRTASVLMKNFGVDGQTAMDLITVGAQRGGNFSGELLDTLREYAPQFKGLGYDAEQFTAILVAGAEAGAFNLDKIGDSAKESFLRVGDGSKASRDALSALGLDFQQIERDIASGGESANSAFAAVVSAISTVEDPAKRSQLAVALMGTPLEDLGPEFQNFFATVNTDLGNFEGAAKNASDALQQSFGEQLQSFLRSAGSALEPLGLVLMDLAERAMPIVTQAIDTASSTFSNLSPTIQMVIVIIGMLAMAIGPILVVVGSLIAAWGTVSAALAGISLPIVAVVAGIALLVTAFVAAYTQSDAFRDKVNAGFEKIKEVATNVFNIVASFIGEKIAQIKQFWDANGTQILQAVTNVFNGIKAVIDFVMPAVKLVIQTIWGAIKDVINGALNIIMGAVKIFSGLFTGDWSKMWEGIKQLVTGAIQLILGWLTLSFFGGIKTVLLNLSKSGISIIKTMWDDILLKFNTTKDDAVKKVLELKDDIVKKFIEMKDDAVKKVLELKDDIVKKFIEMKDDAVKKALELKDDIVKKFIETKDDAVKKALELKDGIVKKFTEMKDEAVKKALELKDEFVKKIKEIDLLEIGKDIVNGLIKGLKAKFESVVATLTELTELIPNWVKEALDIRSPSRVMIEIGKWTGIGLAVGIESTKKRNEEAVKKLTEGIEFWTKERHKAINELNEKQAKEEAQNTEHYLSAIAQIKERAVNQNRELKENEIKEIERLEFNLAERLQQIQKNYERDWTTYFNPQFTESIKQQVYVIKDYIEEKRELQEMSLIQEAAIWEKTLTYVEEGTKEYEIIVDAHQKAIAEINAQIQAVNQSHLDKVNEINTELANSEKRLNDEYTNQLNSRANTLKNFAGLFDSFTSSFVGSGADLINNLDSQVVALEEYNATFNALAAKIGDQELVDELKAMGPKALGELKALNSLSQAELDNFVMLYQKKSELAVEQATLELTGLKETTEQQIIDMRNAANAELDKVAIDWQTKMAELVSETEKELVTLEQVGINAGQGLLSGLASMQSSIQSKALEIANGIRETIKYALDINSPSRVMRGFGVNIGEGLILGIDDMVGKVALSAQRLAQSVESNVGARVSNNYDYSKSFAPNVNIYTQNSGEQAMDRTLRRLAYQF